MLKINKNEYINHNKIECIAEYRSEPLRRLVREAKEKKMFQGIEGKAGYKTIIFLDDGFIFLCPLLPGTYLSKMDKEEFIEADPKRYLLKKEQIRDISSKLTASQRKRLQKAKQDNKFVNLSRNNKTGYYIFMSSGRVYGVHNIKLFEKKYCTHSKTEDVSKEEG